MNLSNRGFTLIELIFVVVVIGVVITAVLHPQNPLMDRFNTVCDYNDYECKRYKAGH